jgi:4-azaleucine resistance transporter AzlC
MSIHSSDRPFWRGAVAALPFSVIVIPFGLLFGVIGIEAGLSLGQTMAMTGLVIAGASQFAAVQLMTENAPLIVVVLSALAVNLRMAMYSATLAVHLGRARFWQRAFIAYGTVDQTFALAAQDYDTRPDTTLTQKLMFFLGASLPIMPTWIIAGYIGAVLGTAWSADLGLDFVIPVAFIAIIGPGLRSFAHIAAAGVSVIVALAFHGLPWNLGLMLAGITGMIIGAEVERRMAQKTGQT